MAFEVQIGSIFAEIDLRNLPFARAAEKTLALAKDLTKKVNDALSRAGEKLGINNTALAKQAKTALNIVRALGADIDRNTREIQLSKIGLSRKAVGRQLDQALGDIRAFGKESQKVFAQVGSGLGIAFNQIRSDIGRDLAAIGTRLQAVGSRIQDTIIIPVGKRFAAIGARIQETVIVPIGARVSAIGARIQDAAVRVGERVSAIGRLASERILTPLFTRAANFVTVLESKILNPLRSRIEAAGNFFAQRLLDPVTRGLASVARTIGARIVDPLKAQLAAAGNFAAQNLVGPITSRIAGLVGTVQARVIEPLRVRFAQAGNVIAQRLVDPVSTRLAGVVGIGKFVAAQLQPILSLGGPAAKAGLSTLQFGFQALGRGAALGIQQSQRLFGTFARGIIIGSKAAAGAMSTAFAGAARAVQATFAGISNVGRSLASSFSGLVGTLTSLPALIVATGTAFGAAQLTERGNEVETLTNGFNSLTTSVGTAADTMLRELRKATRDTIGDFQLMKATNNAVLLGVVQSEEQFAELATAARRLGRSVGRDTIDALDDIVIGIGRQSRLFLDNIGLIVKVEEANDRYAASLGKTAEQLSDTERRTAFLEATTTAVRQKMIDLGEDVLTNADSWGQLRAAISNAFSDIAVAVNGSSFPAAITGFLTDNRTRISAFAKFVKDSVDDVVAFVVERVSGLLQGGISLGRFTRALTDAITALLKGAGKLILVGVRAIFSEIGGASLKLLLALLAQLGSALTEGLISLGVKTVQLTVDLFQRARNAVGNISDAELQDKLQESEQRTQDALARIKRDFQANANEIEQIADAAMDDLVAAVEAGSVGIRRDINDAFADIGRGSGELGERLRANFRQAQLEATSRLKELSQINLIGTLRPLENIYKILVKVVAKSQEIGRSVFFSRTINGLMEDGLAKLKAIFEQTSRNIVQQRKAQEAAKNFLSPDEFNRLLQPLKEQVDAFKQAAGTLDLSEGAQAVEKFRTQIEQLSSRFSPEQASQIRRAFAELEVSAKLRDTEGAIKQLNDELKQLQQLSSVSGLSQLGIRLAEIAAKQRQIVASSPGESAADVLSRTIQGGESIGRALGQQRVAAVNAELAEFNRSLEDAEFNLEQIGKSELQQRLVEIERQFKKEREAILSNRDALEEAFGVDALEILNRFQDVADRLKRINLQIEIRTNITELQEGTERLRATLGGLSVNPLLDELRELDFDIDQKIRRLKLAGASDRDLRPLKQERDARKQVLIDRAVVEDARDLQNRVDELRKDIANLSLTPLQQELAEFDRLVEEKLTRLRQAGASADQIAKVTDRATEQKRLLIQKVEIQDDQALVRETSNAILGGIVDGFVRGEKFGKSVLNGLGNLFQGIMQKSITKISDFLAAKLGSVLGGIGGGFGEAIIGVVGLVLTNLADKSTKAVDDFENSINSSEAVRGVVAGSTNVPIAKIGDQLKEALQTTELLLERIALNQERGVGALAPRASPVTLRNAILPLTPSTGG